MHTNKWTLSGGDWRDFFTKMHSADHFAREQQCTMTELAQLMEDARDSVMTVTFRKKLNGDNIAAKLQAANHSSLASGKAMDSLVKDVLEGELCTMVCHVASNEPMLGRSTVIDLNQPEGQGFRQVDHRSIQSVIMRNVKYVLGKSTKKEDEEMKSTELDTSKISSGNWFSL